MWISHSERPRVDELSYTLTMERGSTNMSTSNVLVIEIVLGYALGLVTISALPSTVLLVGFAPQEYFFHHPALFNRLHPMITEVYLTHLNS